MAAHRIGLTLCSAVAEGIASSGLHPREQRQHRPRDRAGLQSALHGPEIDPERAVRGWSVKLRVRRALGRASCRSSA